MGHRISAWPGCTGKDTQSYLQFQQAEQGIRAMRKILRAYHSKHGINTIEGICRRWVQKPQTPDQEASLREYIGVVARRAHVLPDMPLDMQDRRLQARIAKGIIYAENSRQPYPEALFRRVFRY